jgi:ribose transport system permease protein
VNAIGALRRRTRKATEEVGFRSVVAEWTQRLALPATWGVLCLGFALARPSTFPTSQNFATIFGTQAVLVVLALALLVPLTAGDYDLSVAYTLTLSGMVLALLNVNHHWTLLPSIIAAIAVGLAVGVVNGVLVVGLAIDPFIVTLGTGTFIGGVVLWISGSNTISGISNSLVQPVVLDRFLGIPLEFYFGLAVCVFLWYFLEFTPVGRRVLFVGRGRAVSRLSGIHVSRIRFGSLLASGLLSGLAGVLYVGTTGSADPTSGIDYLLPAFAAAFLGATTIMPGRFNPWGTVIAVYFLATGITGLQLLGVQSYVQQLFYGGALVVAVALSQAARRRQARDE